MGKDPFLKMKAPKINPQAKAKGAAKRAASPAGGKPNVKEILGVPPKQYFVGVGGKKIPHHCSSFKKSGSCAWEKKNPGQNCILPHKTDKQYSDLHSELNP